MLDQLRRVAGIWNWLPAFRAVAETEHLHRASEMLGTSPPALSRTIRLLEEAIGAPLFHRGGKNLQLTDHGRMVAAAIRQAMRIVDEAMATTASDLRLTGALRVSSQGRLTTVYLLGALGRLRRDHPELVPHVTSASPSEVVPKLLRGDLDVALVFQPTPQPLRGP